MYLSGRLLITSALLSVIFALPIVEPNQQPSVCSPKVDSSSGHVELFRRGGDQAEATPRTTEKMRQNFRTLMSRKPKDGEKIDLAHSDSEIVDQDRSSDSDGSQRRLLKSIIDNQRSVRNRADDPGPSHSGGALNRAPPRPRTDSSASINQHPVLKVPPSVVNSVPFPSSGQQDDSEADNSPPKEPRSILLYTDHPFLKESPTNNKTPKNTTPKGKNKGRRFGLF